MNVTSTLVITWARTRHQDGSELSAEDAEAFKQERLSKLTEMWQAEKVLSNIVHVVDDTTTHRYFTSDEAAQEYVDFITALAVTRSLPAPECTILHGYVKRDELEDAIAARDLRCTTPGDWSTAIGASW